MMELTSESIAKRLNDSVTASNLQTITSSAEWSDLMTDYFAFDAKNSNCSESSSDSDLSDSVSVSHSDVGETENANVVVNVDTHRFIKTTKPTLHVSNSDHSNDDQSEQPILTVDGAESIIRRAGLNLVCEDNVAEAEKIRTFSCSCKYNDGLPCFSLFTHEDIQEYRFQMFELAREEKDLIILAQIAAHIQRDANTQCSRRKSQKLRKLTRMLYFHEGKEICRDMFKFFHSISQDKLTGLIKWYKENGLVAKKCKSGGRIKGRALSLEDVTEVVNYVSNYAEAHALVLPGRVPGFKRTDIKLLPSCETKASIWRNYRETSKGLGKRAVKLSGFRSLWRQLLPFIVVTRPMSDLCWKCQDNNTKIYRSANLSEEQKSATLKDQEEHLRVVRLERSYYRSLVEDCKNVVTANKLDLSTCDENSKNITAHYSFDFAQQVFYPNDPLQPGPIYFLVPRKCAIFGVCCEGIPKQVNFLIDEGSSVGKGSNSVVSYIDYFFLNYGLGEMDVHLHADNCSGQNKNNFMLWYLCWRILHKKHNNIGMHFLIAGHTKFAPDWCFGLLKQKYRKTPVSCLNDIAEVVKKSTLTGVNIPQLIGDEAGEQFVPTRDWQTFLNPYFRVLPGIKSYQHFRLSADHPGIVFFKLHSDCEEKQYRILKNENILPPAERPSATVMPDLDQARSQYLHQKIRPFVREDVRDIVCPAPKPNPQLGAEE